MNTLGRASVGIAINCLALQAWGQVPLPLKFHLNLLDHPEVALDQLKRNPKLINSVDKESGETPLLVAAQMGHADLCRWLIEHGANVNARMYNKFTALHLAKNGTIALILLHGHADVDALDTFGATPMQYAAHDVYSGIWVNERREVVEAIRRSGQAFDLFTAAFLDNRTLVLAKIDARPQEALSASILGLTVLHVAARYGDIGIAKRLIELGAKVDRGPDFSFNGNGTYTALAVALAFGQTAMIRFLCENGADPNVIRSWKSPNPSSNKAADREIEAIMKHYAALRKQKGRTLKF